MKLAWPKSGWTQATIALAVSFASSVCVAIHINNSHFATYAREYPHDGQDGLSSLMDAVQAGVATFIGVFALAFVLQRLLTSDSRSHIKK